MKDYPKFSGRWGRVVKSNKKEEVLEDVSARLAFNADRLPSKHYSRPEMLPTTNQMQSVARRNLERAEAGGMDLEEYEAREVSAKEKKHTIMPMHKSNAVVVANPEFVKLMGKKP